MRLLGVLVIAFCISLLSGANNSVAAESISVSKTIKIEAKVLPAQYIVVNSNNEIIEISSNSSTPVLPSVYKDKITENNQIPLNDGVYAQYKKLISSNPLKHGLIYKKAPVVKHHPLTYALVIR